MRTRYDIPFNRPSLTGNEWTYLAEAIHRDHISSDGYFTFQCQAFLEKELGVHKALLTTSCTHALEMTALLLDLKAGDEVILPSFTFVSTANAFVLHGARPVFADIRSDTLNLDEKQVAGLITANTRAIVPVHYGGIACEMDSIMDVAQGRKVAVIEDNAHGLFGKYLGKYLGTFGSLATQSFHETKNFTCGEGGALLINEERYVERAEIIRQKGTDRSRFFRGEVESYSWVDVGSSYLISDLLAAFLLAQFEARQRIQAERQKIWARYYRGLQDWAARNDARLPVVPLSCAQAYHGFYLLLPSLEARQRFIERLKRHGILSVFHYLPLHLSEMGRRYGGAPGVCPVTEQVSDRIVRLPFYQQMTETEQSRVIDVIQEVRVR
jgi:dTDP-4-amino-4,6-dideoxygalactose transaminase